MLVFLGCSSDEWIPLRVDLPITDDHRSVIVGVEAENRALDLRALQIAADDTIDPIVLPFDMSTEVTVTALLYDVPLRALDLERGPVEQELVKTKQRPLPRSRSIQQLTIKDGTISSWGENSLPEAIEDFHITQEDPCVRFIGSVHSLGNGGQPTFALPLDDQWVLIGTSTRLIPSAPPAVFVVNWQGTVHQISSMPSSFFSGHRASDGRIWLGGEGGVVYAAAFQADPPALTVTASSTLQWTDDIIRLVGPEDGPPEFALTTDRSRAEDQPLCSFEQFDGRWVQRTWRRVPFDASFVAPGYGLFTSFWRGGTVLGWRDGSPTEVTVTSVFGNASSVGAIPGMGLAVGTTGGEVHFSSDEINWKRVANPSTGIARKIHPYRDGLVYLHDSNLYEVMLSEDPPLLCEAHNVGHTMEADIAVLGEDVIVPLLADRGEDQLGEQSVAWFAR